MQLDSRAESGFARHAEESILAELQNARVILEPTLKNRVRDRVSGFSDKAYKVVLEGLVAARKIHGRPKLSKAGRPTKAMESYVFGAPPSPKQVVPQVLEGGALSPAELKAKVVAGVPGLSVKDYGAALSALLAAHQIHARFKLGKTGKPTKTVERYALGAPPPPAPGPFLVPVLGAWSKACEAAKKAGVSDSALIAALVKELGLNASSGEHSPVTLAEAREQVLAGVRELVRREGSGALIPIRQLRAALSLPKADFDRAVFELRDADGVILHHHEYVGSLSEAERGELVVDRYGNYYMGVALRGES